jgi:hypothetical protein
VVLNDIKINFANVLGWGSVLSTNLKRKSGVIKEEVTKAKNITVGKNSKNFIVDVGVS